MNRLLLLLLLLLVAACSGTEDGITRTAPRGDTGDVAVPTSETAADTAVDTGTPPEPEPEPVSWQNPVYDDDFPDPFVLAVSGGYLAYGTNTWWANVPVLSSADLSAWDVVTDALPVLPDWALSGASLTWAPSVLDRGDGTWVLYFVARDLASDRQCIGAATAFDPAGPFVDALGEPLVCQAELGGSIDPDPFVAADGSAFLLWKSDGNCCDLEIGLWSAPLGPDGVSFAGPATRLLVHDQVWEAPLIENPVMLAHEGTFHLLYSGGWWESVTYAVGHAICESPSGPCEKLGDEPILATEDPVWGPGGQAVLVDADDRSWLVYHAWTAPLATYDEGGVRSLRIDPIVFGPGTLQIDGPSSTPRSVP